MARTKISEFSATPASNTDIDSIFIGEGMAPSNVNDAIRELMAQLKDWQSGTSNDPYVVGSSGSLTLNQGTANGVPYLNGSKVVTSGSALTFDGTNLGVGTSSPAAKLDVSSSGEISRFRTSTARGSGNGYYGLYDPTGRKGYYGYGGSDDSLYIANEMNAPMLFITNSIERMRLDSSGNLGLGVTPSAWDSARAFQFGPYGGSLAGSTGQSGIYLNSNVYYGSGAWRYATTGTATQYKQNENTGYGGHSWLTAASGTAGNAITFTQAMTLDASGNLSIGTTTPYSTVTVGSTDATATLSAGGGNTNFTIRAMGSQGSLIFGAGGVSNGTPGTERARIDSSGNLLVGTTSNGGVGTSISENAGKCLIIQNTSTTSTNTMTQFKNPNGQVGTIQTSGSSTLYNTSSDYRLKENIQPMTGALAKVAELKPCTYKWKVDGSDGEGFIAHELAEVVPQCVSGEKDAVDAEGNPQYQGIDTSFLVATLTAAIQELKAEFDAYKATHP